LFALDLVGILGLFASLAIGVSAPPKVTKPWIAASFFSFLGLTAALLIFSGLGAPLALAHRH
jgi:hypothetical protein